MPNLIFLSTVAPRYNEVSGYRKKMFVIAGSSAITKYLVNNKNICYSRVTKLDQVKQWDIHHANQSTDLHVDLCVNSCI